MQCSKIQLSGQLVPIFTISIYIYTAFYRVLGMKLLAQKFTAYAMLERFKLCPIMLLVIMLMSNLTQYLVNCTLSC